MRRKQRVVLIGSTGRGDYGHLFEEAWKDVADQIEFLAVADESEPGRRKAQAKSGALRTYADYREMLDQEKPDIVIVAPRWIDRHAEMVLAAVERGCHVYMDKPFCRTLEEADRIVAACERTHAKLAIAHISRYCPILRVAQRLIAEGGLGKVLEIRGRGKEDHRGGGEDTWVDGVHIFNLMNVFGGNPVSCQATVRKQGKPVVAADIHDGNEGLGPLAGDSVNARYEFDSGIIGYFGSELAQLGSPSRFAVQVFGSKGILEFPSGYLGNVNYLPDPSWSPGRSGKAWIKLSSAGVGQPEPLKVRGYPGGHAAVTRDLLAAIAENRQPLCNVYQARTTLEFILGAFESHRQGGRVVKLPLQERRHPLQLMQDQKGNHHATD